jgi:hypothetical protein
MTHERSWSGADVTLFCVLTGIVATFAGGYTYGEFNQVEHLPMIFRAMDPGYLAQDFFVNAVDTFNPRFYYVWLMAVAGHWIVTPLLFVVLTCAANAAIAGVTWHIARRMSAGSTLTAMLACCTVLAVNAFNEGGAAQIPREFLGPSLLARPVAMLALWWTINGAVARAVPAFVVAMALHPLVGAETAAIALAATAVAVVAGAADLRAAWATLLGAELRRLLAGGAAIGVAAYLLYGGSSPRTLSTERFIRILAEARGPHHYLPSLFGIGSHLAFVVFCIAVVMSWARWRRHAPRPVVVRAVLAVVIVVLLACLGGYVFVEVLPTRLWTAAQPFRMTYLVKWFGLILFAVAAGRAIGAERPLAQRLSGSLLVLGVGRYQPAIALMGNVGLAIGERLGEARSRLAAAVVGCFMVLAAVLVFAPTTSRPQEPLLLASLLAIGACFTFIEAAVWRRVVAAAAVGAVLLPLVALRASPAVIDAARSVGAGAPRMSLSESAKAWTEAAWFARANTPEDAVFVVPPRLGGFRLIARRAVVVDNKVFPFGDADMEEWYERMLFTHAGRLEGDLPSLIELDDNYAVIDAGHLLRVRERYGATHALLWSQTPTDLPVLYEDAAFKIVRIDAP